MGMRCPCGCGYVVELLVVTEAKPRWDVRVDTNGTPTLTPSVWLQKGRHSHFLGSRRPRPLVLKGAGFNSTLSNKRFKDKRDRTDSEGRAVGYKNGLKLNAELATADAWSVEQIDARTTMLAD